MFEILIFILLGGVIVDIDMLRGQIVNIVNRSTDYDLLDFIYKLLIHSGEHTQDSAELGRGEIIEH